MPTTITVRATGQSLPRSFTLPNGTTYRLVEAGDELAIAAASYDASGVLAGEIEADLIASPARVEVYIDGVQIANRTRLHEVAGATSVVAGTWDKPHTQFVSDTLEYHEWVDAQGNVRRKVGGPPTSETDGTLLSGGGGGGADEYGVGSGQEYGSDFKGAVDAITGNTASTPKVVAIGPGTYSVNNPVGLKGYVLIRGVGKEAVRLVAQNPGAPMFSDTGVSGWVEIHGLTVVGGTKVLAMDNAPAIRFYDVEAENQSDEVFSINNGSGVLKLENTDIVSLPALNAGVRAISGTVEWTNGVFTNTGDTAVAAVNADSGTIVRLRNVRIVQAAGTITRSLDVDQSTVEVENVEISGGTTGLYISDNAASIVKGTGLRISGTQTYDVEFAAGDANSGTLNVDSADWNGQKVSGNPNGLRAQTVGNYEARAVAESTRNQSIGTPEASRRQYIGDGAPYNRNIIIKRSDDQENGPYTDLSAALGVNRSGSALFGGLDVDRSIYLQILPNTRTIEGIDLMITTAQVGGTVVVEGWTGAQYDVLATFTKSLVAPYATRNGTLLTTGLHRIYFDRRVLSTLVAKTIDGVNAKSIRLRVTSGLTTDPIVQWIEFHSNSRHHDAAGGLQTLGAGRREVTVMLPIDGQLPDSNGPTIGGVAIATGLIHRYFANHPNAANTFLTFELMIEDWMDLSSGLIPFLRWKVDGAQGAGNVDWRLNHAFSIINALESSAVPLAGTDTKSLPSGVQNNINETVFDKIDISGLRPGDTIVFEVMRLGSTDQYSGNVQRRAFGVRALRSQDGTHT